MPEVWEKVESEKEDEKECEGYEDYDEDDDDLDIEQLVYEVRQQQVLSPGMRERIVRDSCWD